MSQPFTEKQNQDSFLAIQEYMLGETPFFIGRVSGNEANLSGAMLNGSNVPNGLIYEMLHAAGIQSRRIARF